MARRITDLEKDLPILNAELARLDTFQQNITKLQADLAALAQRFLELRNNRSGMAINNLTFHWNGPTLKLSWGNGFVQDRNLKNWPVVANELSLAASSTYWLAWNPRQHQMASDTDLQVLFSNSTASPGSPFGNNLVICRVTTLGAGATGDVGGGGTDSGGTGPVGKEY